MNFGSITSAQYSAHTAYTAQNASQSATRSAPAPQLADLPPMNLSRESLAADSAVFADNLRQRLADAGIQIPPEPVLTTGYDGRVIVANQHPDKVKIERILSEDNDLHMEFNKLSGDASLLRATEAADKFSEDYAAANGNQAATQALVDRQVAYNKAPFSMAITADGYEHIFGVRVSS